jgi:hypothetical protein
MENKLYFCTLFNSFYLSRGLAMYRSLEKTCLAFHLYIFAFDDKTHQILTKLQLKHASVISLYDFEDEKLLSVKSGRTLAEYCWTCTSSTIMYVIEKYNVPSCTYIDADLFFYKDPQILFDEMGNNSILITEHRYPPKFNRTNSSGIYCVQFITFVNDENGLKALKWWRDACIDWCYDRYEDGKFGDQKYLDDWPTRFKGVHVLQNLGGGLASWNVEQYPFIERKGDTIIFKDKVSGNNFEAVFYHFHHVRFFKNDIVDLGWRHPTMPVVNHLYVPYIRLLLAAEQDAKSVDPAFDVPLKDFTLINNTGLKNKLKYLIKVVLRFNVFNFRKLLEKNPRGND